MLAISGRTELIHVDERNARCREQRLDIPPPNRSSIATQSSIDNERASGFVRTKARSVRLHSRRAAITQTPDVAPPNQASRGKPRPTLVGERAETTWSAITDFSPGTS
jgi:hypothetical protein